MPAFLVQLPPGKFTKINGKSGQIIICATADEARQLALAKIPESGAGWRNAVVTDLSDWAIAEPARGVIITFGNSDRRGA